MKLKNKKTGEILGSLGSFIIQNPNGINCESITKYDSLAKLNEEWEDAPEEPKKYWYIDIDGEITYGVTENVIEQDMQRIGNYFKTREEAEKAVEKLKAWKRLKDDGLKIRKYELNGGTDKNGCFYGDICLTLDISKPVYEDILQLLFGGEE